MKKRLALLIVLFIIGVIALFYGNLQESGITGYFAKIMPFTKSQPVCEDCNVILILIDTLRADHVGAYGYERNTTPNIDKLAEEGILFKNMLAQTSWTKPGTASILTGLYPKHHGANDRYDRLSEDKLLLSEILKEEGYGTHAFISNFQAGSLIGFNQSYDSFVEFPFEIVNGHARYETADKINQKVIQFIGNLEKTSKQFIYVHYFDPHDPYNPPEKKFSKANQRSPEYLNEFFKKGIVSIVEEGKASEVRAVTKERINLYDDEILFSDKAIGELIKTLKEKEMYDNSVIIVISDHGEEFWDHGWIGHGKTLFNEQLKVPLIMRVPDLVPAIVEKQVNQIDLVPTVLKLLAIPVPNEIDGMNALYNNNDNDNQKNNGRENEYSYAELSYKGNYVRTIQSLKHKLISTALIGQESKDSFAWYQQEATIPVYKVPFTLSLLPFSPEQKMRISFAGKELDLVELVPPLLAKKVSFHVHTIQLNYWPEDAQPPLNLTIRSLSPCKKVSDFGIANDNRCFNFGIAGSSDWESEELILPGYGFFTLQDDPEERFNKLTDAGYGETINQLEDKLLAYIKEGNSKQKQRQQDLGENAETEGDVTFSEEQLESLKALGYM